MRLFDEEFAERFLPGLDFANDPLLRGRNSPTCLGGPNFAQLPINAPKCLVALSEAWT